MFDNLLVYFSQSDSFGINSGIKSVTIHNVLFYFLFFSYLIFMLFDHLDIHEIVALKQFRLLTASHAHIKIKSLK